MKGSSTKTKGRKISGEVIAAVVLGIASVATFLSQVFTLGQGTTEAETSLFNLLQFVLTAGFAWFSTRAISRHEFRQNLRQFAIGAYRRIADIDAMVSRLKGEVAGMLAEAPPDAANDLRIVEAITTDACQVVRSSIADWADVLGEELDTIERIRDLHAERRDLASEGESPSDGGDRLQAIEAQIEELSERLPAQLRLDVHSELRKAYADRHAAEWLAQQHALQDGLVLSVVTGDNYRHDREWDSVEIGEDALTLHGPEDAVEVVDLDGQIIGRLQNPSPLDYPDFVRAMKVCYGVGPVPVRVMSKREPEVRSGDVYGWFRVQVTADPMLPRRYPEA